MPLKPVTVYKPGERCSTCNLSRCNCIRCGLCSERVSRKVVCDKCKVCAKHHNGFYPKDFPHRGCDYVTTVPVNNTFAINPLHRTIGVELELGVFASCAANCHNKHITWQIDHDGSVSGSGQELVTARMSGDQYVYGMSELVRDLTNGGSQSNETCGYHVHVDAAEFNPLDLRRIGAAFALIQNELYGTLVDARRGTGSWGQTYCPRLKWDVPMIMAMDDKNVFINWLHQWLYGVQLPDKNQFVGMDSVYKSTLREIDEQLKNYKNTKYMNRARRWALNFHSWMMRGTMEFRLKEMTMDPGDIIMWPLWCAWFIEKFGNASDKDIHYFMKKGLTLGHANEFMCDGPMRMPQYVADWVRSK